MTVYDEKILTAYSKRVKKGLWITILPFCFMLALSVALCFFLNEEKTNANLLHYTIVAVNGLIGWFSLSVLLGYVLPSSKRKKFVQGVLNAPKTDVRGKVVAIGDTVTIRENVKISEIAIDRDGSISTVYFDAEESELQFKVGDTLKMTVARNFICEYEAVDDEKEI